MATDMLQYLDPDGLDETVLNIAQIKTSLEEEMQNLPYARPDGLYPDMTVGAVIGADSTAQWATRESTGSGSATVRNVQGNTVVWNQLLRVAAGSSTSSGVTVTKRADGSVTVEGTASTINYFALDSSLLIPIVTGHKYLVYGPPSDADLNLHIPAAGVMAQIYDGQIYTANQDSGSTSYAYVFVKATFSGTYTFTPQLFDLTQMFGSGNEPTTVAEFEQMYPEAYYPYSAPTLKPVQISGIRSIDAQGGELDTIEWTAQTLRAAGSVRDELTAGKLVTRVDSRAYQSGDESDSSVITDMTTTFYPLTTPTTTPISPALPMTYKVQQGGSESIIVPDGEVSAAPILTIAEPVNMSTELARIWAAIQSLGYTQNTAQLSRPVSLTDIGSIDEVQKDTTDVVEIDTTKEVTK